MKCTGRWCKGAAMVGSVFLITAPLESSVELTLQCHVYEARGAYSGAMVLRVDDPVLVRVRRTAVTVVPGAGRISWVYDKGVELSDVRLEAYRELSTTDGVRRLYISVNRFNGEASLSYPNAAAETATFLPPSYSVKMECRPVSNNQRLF